MIKALRRKFILTTMTLLTAVLAIMLIVLNLIVRESRMQTALAEMSALSSATRVPRFKLREDVPENAPSSEDESRPPSPAAAENAPVYTPVPVADRPHRHSWSDGMAFKEMYAVVTDQNGVIISRVRMFDFGLEEDELTALTQEAFQSKRENGRIGNYLYLKAEKASSTMIILRNYSDDLATDRQMLLSSVLIGLAALAVLFVITFILARKVTLPAELAFKQQKQFIADASHELKTPLSTVAINAEVLKSDIGPNKWLDNILLECGQMEELVFSLLTLAKLDAGEKLPFDAYETDLSEICSETVLSFESVAYEKQLTLTDRIAEGISVRGNRSELKHLMTVLLDNAVKYVEDRGAIEVTLQKKDQRAMICVSNTGPDISSEVLPHLFERFYRADSSRSGEKSFGLGLAIADEIVKRHGGKISVTSSGGKTVFTVTL